MPDSGTEDLQIVVNGQVRLVPPGQTLAALLRWLELDPARVAVELDRSIVPRDRWGSTAVQDGARFEIVQFVGGG